MSVTIRNLLDETHQLDLTVRAGEDGLDNAIESDQVQKSGLAMTGYSSYIYPGWVQVLGNSEISYLGTQPEPRRREILTTLCQVDVACIVITRGLPIPDPLLEICDDQRLPLMTTPLGLVVVFVCGAHADLSSGDSLFPQRMFNLPLSTRALVGSPMFVGVSTMFLACVVLIALTLRTIQPQCPMLWPALLAAVCLAWLQVLAWVPFGLPYVRVVVGVPLVGCVIALPGPPS